jgi:acyl dehydratase
VVLAACGADPTRLVELSGQFRKPVWPGDTIRTSGYDLGGGRLALQVHAADRPDPVMTSCWAALRPLEE